MAEPDRFIQTTLTFEDKAATFIFVEGALPELLSDMEEAGLLLTYTGPQHIGMLSEVRITPNPPSVKEVMILSAAAKAIHNPFNDLNEETPDVLQHQAPWTEALLETEKVIITQSPPKEVSFRSQAKAASGAIFGKCNPAVIVGAGTTVGGGVVAGLGLSPLLLIIAVPGGIIACGAAVGLGTGVGNRLNEWITNAMRPKSK